MAAKRALVVDDSKSARAFLSSLLEKHNLEVDAAESAEDAIEYLTRHRPDVIFMDHLMPGMDGFQAVQAIKANPRTATIPILMYTSQEGELYLGQARALGAIGVLPKQIAPADVTKVLHQLRLAEDRRGQMVASPFIPIVEADADAETVIAPSLLAAPPGTLHAADLAVHTLDHAAHAPVTPEVLLRDQIAELRRFMVATLDEQTERLLEDVRLMLRDTPRDAPPPAAAVTPPKPALDRRWLGLALAASIAALLFAGLWLNESADRRSLQRSLNAANQNAAAAAATTTEPAAVDPAAESPPDAGTAPAATPRGAGTAAARTGATPRVPPVTVLAVPYGEVPLAGARVERVRSLLMDLAQSGFRGVVDVHTYPGRYCLAGNDVEGYSLAPDELTYLQCDVLGNPADERQGSSQRQSLPFASMIAERRRASDGAIDIRISNGTADQMAKPYPEIGSNPPRVPSAAEWNSVAADNNRVEVRWAPAN